MPQEVVYVESHSTMDPSDTGVEMVREGPTIWESLWDRAGTDLRE